MLKITTEKLPQSKMKIKVSISSELMRGFFTRVYNKLAPKVIVKGFRPGMAPKTLTVAAIGENRLNADIIDLALQETYTAALKKENIFPLCPPQINIKMLKDLTVETAEMEYEAEVDILPKVEIGEYKKIKINPPAGGKEIKVAEEEIEQVLSHLQREKATFEIIERSLKEGDRAEINFEGFEKGVKLENLSSQNYPVILGNKVLLPEFEKNLVGLKKGDKKEFKISVPGKDGPEKLIDFKVAVLTAQAVILPKLDDEFAKNFQKKDLAELKSAIKKDILLQKKETEKKERENQVIEELLKMTAIEIPASLIEQEVERQINEIRKKLEMMGMTFEKYLESLKKNLEEFRASLKSQAEKNIKVGLALGEVARREKIDSKDKNAAKIALERLIEYATK